MKRALALLTLLPALAACGNAADESDDPPAAGTGLTTGVPADSAAAGTSDTTLAEPAPGNTAPPPVVGTGNPSDPAAVPPTNQGAQYQDSVTETPEAAP